MDIPFLSPPRAGFFCFFRLGAIAENNPADQTDSWYHQLEAELRAQGISGLCETMRLAVVSPEESIRSLPARMRKRPARRQLFCKRDQLVTLVFSPVRKADER